MRLVGSLVCWVLPDRVLEDAAFEGFGWPDILSHILGAALTFAVLFQLSAPTDPGSFSLTLVGSLFGVSLASVVFCYGLSWAHFAALRDHKVDGKPLDVDTMSLFGVNLHVYAVLLNAVLVAILTGHLIAVGFSALAVARTLDLQARAARHLFNVDAKEGYKIAAVLFLIVAAGCAIPYVIARVL